MVRSTASWRTGPGISLKLAPPDARTSIDWKRDAGDEVRLIGCKEQGGVGDVPAGAHLLAQGHLPVALGLDLGAGLVPLAGAGIDRHWRVHQPRQDDIGANAVLG